MIKRKNPPSKPGWYVAWFDGDTLNMDNNDLEDKRNIFYWDGSQWFSHMGYRTFFQDPEYKQDRWSYLPKNHSMRGKLLRRYNRYNYLSPLDSPSIHAKLALFH